MLRKTAGPAPQHTTRGEQTRLRIIQAATGLVHRHGFHHTSLDDILAAAKVPKGSLYFYFRNIRRNWASPLFVIGVIFC